LDEIPIDILGDFPKDPKTTVVFVAPIPTLRYILQDNLCAPSERMSFDSSAHARGNKKSPGNEESGLLYMGGISLRVALLQSSYLFADSKILKN
jgi:hypothetical protein